jgi:hypothetical protein
MNCPHCQAVMTEKDASTGRCPACGGELNAAPASQPAAQANPASSPPAKPPEAKPASTSSPASSASRPAGRPRAESTFGQTASVCLYWLATWVLLAVVLGGGLWLKVWDRPAPLAAAFRGRGSGGSGSAGSTRNAGRRGERGVMARWKMNPRSHPAREKEHRRRSYTFHAAGSREL